MDEVTEAAVAQLEREHARLQRLAATPEDPAAAAARRERRQAMTTGQREDMSGGLSARTPRAG